MTMKRDLFSELSEGFEALKEQRHEKRTLRTHRLPIAAAPNISGQELIRLRQQLSLSRPVFAQCLRTNRRTLENWEQGRAKPNAQAALLIKLVSKYPDTIERLAEIKSYRGDITLERTLMDAVTVACFCQATVTSP